jgi:hypothetical protein
MGAGSGPAALQLAARIQDAKARAEKEQHDRDREVVRDEQIKADADRADQRILQKHIDQQMANQRLLIAETAARTKRDKIFAQDREEPAYRIAIHGLNVFDPDFPSHLAAVNARYPNISVTDNGRGIAALKMADAGMKFTAQGIEYIPGQIQDTYRKAEAVLGYDELRDLATYSRSTGKFLEIDAFEVEQSVHRKRAEAARKLAAPGEDFTISERGGVTIRGGTPPPPKPVDPAKEASEKARDKRWKDSHRLQINNNQLKEWHIEKGKLTNLKDVSDKQQHLAKIRYAEGEIKKLQDDSDRILKSHAQEDAPTPPVPDSVPASPVTPAPATTTPATGAAPAPAAPATGAAGTPVVPASKPPLKSARDLIFGKPATPPASQPQASASPYGDPLAEIKRFTGSRADVESDPAMAAEFDSVSESARSMLADLGYDDESIDGGLQSVLDGQTLYVADGEAGTEDDEGTRAPLKKPAATVASVDSSSTAS